MLELDSVTAGYDAHMVLRDVSLTVPDHSVVALLGPNGAGKTTLLRVASGVLEPRSGARRLDGRDATTWSPDHLAREGVCHVPEGRGIFSALTVRDNLRLQAPARSDRGIEPALDTFPRLRERLHQQAGTLSGGEQQMLAMAHAYLSNPSVVLLDEVSMGLAPRIVDELFDYLAELRAQGIALLIVEQYVTRALELADYVYILNKGEVAFVGEPGEVGDEQILSSYLGTAS